VDDFLGVDFECVSAGIKLTCCLRSSVVLLAFWVTEKKDSVLSWFVKPEDGKLFTQAAMQAHFMSGGCETPAIDALSGDELIISFNPTGDDDSSYTLLINNKTQHKECRIKLAQNKYVNLISELFKFFT